MSRRMVSAAVVGMLGKSGLSKDFQILYASFGDVVSCSPS